MTARTKYQVGTGILFLAIFILIVEVLGMLSVIPKYAPTTTTNGLVFILVLAAAGLRRSARKDMAAGKTESQ